MHPALRKRSTFFTKTPHFPLFLTKITPHFSLFLQKNTPHFPLFLQNTPIFHFLTKNPFHFLPTGLTAACYECLLMAVVVG